MAADTQKKNPELKCSHMLRTCRGYRNEDNDLKCMAAALKLLSHESQRESKLKMKLHSQFESEANKCLTCLFGLDKLHMCPLQRG